MNRRWFSLAALPAMMLFFDPALAADASTAASTPAPAERSGPTGFEPAFGATSSDVWSVVADAHAAAAEAVAMAYNACQSSSQVVFSRYRQPRFESIRYRRRERVREREERRRSSSSSSSDIGGFSQIHGGFIDPDGLPPKAVLFGVRAGANLDDSFQLGFGLDWSHKSDQQSEVVTDVPIPGGGTAERRTVLAQSSANLVPMMAFLQFSPGSDLPISPYVGAGAGYEVLFLDAENFETGEKFEATYDGWGWQAWGGVAMPLSGKTRLAAEVFWNEADLDREIDDPAGSNLREVIPMTGMGMRFGFSWGF
jgi:hypothetical protein